MFSKYTVIVSVTLAALSLSGCPETAVDDKAATSADKGAATADQGDERKAPGEPATPGGKLSAPINIEYRILGTPIIGQPLPIELTITSPLKDRPIAISYHINDSASMMFPESQTRRVDVRIANGEDGAARQVTVIPQREGRVYLNIQAEIATDEGSMIKSIAIPVAVGPGTSEPEVNGELVRDPDGEDVISMPAREN
jgi:hypothetical protein